MVVHYKKNGMDVAVDNVIWLDVFMTTSENIATFMKDGQEINIPLHDLVSVTDK